MRNKKELPVIKLTMPFDFLTDLMQGHCVGFIRKPGEPTIEIRLEEDERPEDLDDALRQVEQNWEYT